MTAYKQTMAQALQSMYLSEDNMDLMRKAAGGAAQTVKMKDGKLKMDMFTASAIMQVFDKVNPANQKKMAVMINKGTKTGMLKLQDFAMKQVKSENDPEIEEEADLDEGKQKPYVSSDKDGAYVMNASGKIVKSFKDMDSANAYLDKNYNKLKKEEVELDEDFSVEVPKQKIAGKTYGTDFYRLEPRNDLSVWFACLWTASRK